MNPKTNLISFTSNSKECDFKIGSKKQPGTIFDKNYTYDKENTSSFKMMKVHDKQLFAYLEARVGQQLIHVDRKDFVAAANITNLDVVKAVNEIMNRSEKAEIPEAESLKRIREACANVVMQLTKLAL
jgi:hypothetical protein